MSFDKSNTPSNDLDSTSVSTRGISLKTKTLTAIGALMILIIGCADALEFWQLRQEGAAQLATRASLVVAVQADALAQPMWDIANEQVERMLGALTRDPDFLSAEVISPKGKRVATAGQPDSQQSAIEQQANIYQNGDSHQQVLGKLILRLSTASLERTQAAQLRYTILKLILILGSTMAAIYVALRLITTPVDKMTSVMKSLSEGDTEIEIPATERSDEIGAMARAVSVFKRNAVERRHLEAEQIELKEKAELQRRSAMMSLAAMFEKNVRGVVDTLSGAGKQLQETSISLAEGASRVDSRVAAVVRGSDEATLNVQKLAAAATELSTTGADIRQRAAFSAEMAGRAVNETETIKSIDRKPRRYRAEDRGRRPDDHRDRATDQSARAQRHDRSRTRRRRRTRIRGRRIRGEGAFFADGEGDRGNQLADQFDPAGDQRIGGGNPQYRRNHRQAS